jgi:hypothetical protein
MSRESARERVAKHVKQKTPELLRYSAKISGLWSDEHPRKTALEARNHEKTLTVHKDLFRKESVPLWMRGFMTNTRTNSPLPVASVDGPAFFLRRQRVHRPDWGTNSKGFGAPWTNGDSSWPGDDASEQFWLKVCWMSWLSDRTLITLRSLLSRQAWHSVFQMCSELRRSCERNTTSLDCGTRVTKTISKFTIQFSIRRKIEWQLSWNRMYYRVT